jgi:hypothetical protein
MNESRNVETVRSIYSAFTRGDISGILDYIDEAIVFTVPGSAAVPWSGVRRGIEEVRRFFEDLARRLEFSVFQHLDFIAQGNRVVALIHYEGRDRTTSRRFSAEAAMLWTFANGKAIRCYEYTDTEALAAAAKPQAHSLA